MITILQLSIMEPKLTRAEKSAIRKRYGWACLVEVETCREQATGSIDYCWIVGHLFPDSILQTIHSVHIIQRWRVLKNERIYSLVSAFMFFREVEL
jgi:hypothetical protein